MHQRQLAFLADGALFRCVVGQVQLEGACHDGNGRRSLGLGAVHHAGDAQADAAGLFDDTLGLQRGDAGGHDVLSDEALLTRMDGEALQGHHVVHALGEDSALAGLAGQLVGVDDAAHGRSDDDVHVHLLDLIGHSLHGLGTAVGVLLQICHLAVCAGMAARRQQEVTFQKCVTALQNFKCFTHCSSPSLFMKKYLLNGIVPRFCSNCKFMRKFSLYTHKPCLFWYISSIIQHFVRSRGSPPAFSRRGHPSTVPSRRQWSPWRGGWQSLPRPPAPPWHLP